VSACPIDIPAGSSALAEIPPKRRDEAIYEFACHEGNVSMAGMLRTACLADAVGDGRRPR
jgi:hypothetical protein